MNVFSRLNGQNSSPYYKGCSVFEKNSTMLANFSFFKNALFLTFFVAITSVSWGQRTAGVSGDWNNTSTWGGNSVPTSTDAVTINQGVTVTVNVTNATCASLVIGSASGVGTLTFALTGSPVLTVLGNVSVGNSGNQNRNGTITFTSGSMLIANSLNLGATGNQEGTIIMTSGGYLKVNGSITVGGTGSVWTPGTGTVELTANNTLPNTKFTTFNNLTISGGATKLGVNTTISGTLSLTTGSLDVNNFTGSAGEITGSGSLTNTGITARTFTIGSSNTNTTYSGVISATTAANLAITKTGTGTLTLSGLNTYSGATTVSEGTLKAGVATTGANGAFGNASAVSMANVASSILDITGFNTTIGSMTGGGTTGGNVTLGAATLTIGANNTSPAAYAGIISGTGAITKNGTGALTLSGANTYSGLTTVSAGTLKLGVSSSVSTAGPLGTTGSGTTVTSGAALDLNSFSLTNAATEALSLNGTGISSGGALTNSSGTASNYIGLITIASSASIITAGDINLANTGAISSDGLVVTVGGTGIGQISGVFSANTSITKIGGGTWTLSGTNTYAGPTLISTGTLKLGNTSALGSASGSVTVSSGGALDLNGYSLSVVKTTSISGTGVASLGAITNSSSTPATYSGTITLAGSSSIVGETGSIAISNIGQLTGSSFTLTLGGTTGGSFSSILNTGSGGLTKIGSGTWTINAYNYYNGTTTISAGTLKLGIGVTGNLADRGPLGSNSNGTTVADGAVLDLNGFSFTTSSTPEALTLNGSGISSGGALTNTGAAATFNGAITLASASTISATTSGRLTCSGTVSGAFSLTLNGAGTGTMSGVISTPTSLTKNGAGTWTLSGTNTYTGTTTLSDGVLELGAANSIANGSAFTYNGGTFSTGATTGFSETIGVATLSANSTIKLGTGVHTLTIANSSAATWGAFTLTINGWTGTAGSAGGGTAGKIQVGVGGLSAAQLDKIQFTGYPLGSAITSTGECVPVSKVTYYSQATGAPNTLSNWNTVRTGGGSSPANFTDGDVFVIQNGHVLTTSSAWSVSGTSSKVQIENGGTLIATFAITLDVATTFQIDNGGNYQHGVNSTAVFAGTNTFGATSTVTYNFAGTQSIFDVVTPGYGNLTLAGTGTKTAPASTLDIQGNVLISSPSIFNAGTSQTHNIQGNWTNNGTFSFTTGSTINFNGNNALQTISGSATTTFGTITVAKTAQSNILEVTSAIGLNAGGLTLTSGTFKLSGTFSLTNTFFSTTSYTIPAAAGFWLNNANVTVTAQGASPTLSGLLRVTAGTYNIGTSSGNTMSYNSGAILTLEGGTINVAGRFSPTTAATSTVTYNQSGGIITVCKVGSTSGTLAPFDLGATGSSFTMSSGSIVFQNTSSNVYDYLNLASTNSVTGGTIQFGNTSTTASPVFAINSSAPVFNLTVNPNGTPKLQLATNALTVKGTVSIGSGTTLDAGTNAINMNVAGDWTNNGGTFTPGTATVTFNGTADQAINGSASTTFTNLTINAGTAPIKVTNATKAFAVTGNLSVTKGNLVLKATDANYTVTGNLSVAANGTLTHEVDWDIASKQLTVSGNLTLDGVYSKGTVSRAHVSMDGSWKTVSSGTSSFSILTLSTTGTITASGNLTVDNNFWAPYGTAGTFNTGGFNITTNEALVVAGNTTTNGTFNITGASNVNVNGIFYVGYGTEGGTLTMNGTGTLTTNGIALGTATGTKASTITQSSGTLTVNGDVTINQPTTAGTANTWNINTRTATVSGLITFAGTDVTTTKVGKIVITTGTLNANGGITFVGSNAATKVIDMSGGAGNLNLKGALTVPTASSTLTPGTSSTFSYVDAATQTINKFSTGNYYNLAISGAGLKTFAALNAITNNLSIATGASADLGSQLIHTAASLTLGGSTQSTGSSYGGTGSAAATINSTFFANNTGIVNVGTCTSYSLTSTTVATSACINAAASVTLSHTTASNLPVGAYTVYYTLTGANTGSFNASMSVTTAGTGSFTTGTLSNDGSTTITINFIRIASAGCVSKISSGNTATFSVTPASVGGTIAGSATVCSGTNSTVLTLSGHTGTITKWQSSTTSDFSSAVTDIVNATTSQTATNLTATTYYRAVLTSGSCAAANSATATVTVTTVNTWTGATSTNWHTASNWTCGVPTATSAVSIRSSAVNQPTIGAAAVCSSMNIASGASITSSGSNTLTLTDLSNAGTFIANAGTLSIGGTFTNTGTFTANTGTVNYNGAAQTIVGVTYNNLTLSGSGVKTAPAGTLTVLGNLSRSGTHSFAAGTGRVSFTGTAQQVYSADMNTTPIEFYDVSNTNTVGLRLDSTIGIQNELNLNSTAKLNLNTGNVNLRSTNIRTAYVTNLGTTAASTNITYVNGKFIIERFMKAAASWRLMATPITAGSSPTISAAWREGQAIATNTTVGLGTRITGPSGMDEYTQRASMKYYNMTNNTYVDVNAAALGQSIQKDQGYYVFVRGDRTVGVGGTTGTTNLRVAGQLRTGNQTFSVIKNLAPAAGFQSVGNPYASRIDVRNVILFAGGVSESFYLWNPTGGYYNVGQFELYAKYLTDFRRNGSPAGAVLNTIESGQAFFLQNNSTTTDGSITIKEADKVTGSSSTPVSRIGVTTPTLEINLLTNDATGVETLVDGAAVNFEANYANTVDNNDVRKITNTYDNVGLKQGAVNLAVERRNSLVATDTLRLNMTGMRVASYKFEIDPSVLDTIPLSAFLVDKFLVTETPVSLTAVTTVPFSTTSDATSRAADRFMIVFRPGGVLPVTFTGITAEVNTNKTHTVKWFVSNEVNLAGYVIERSSNGVRFDAIGNAAVTGTTAYSFIDASPLAGVNYYRVKATSANGQVQYSAIVKLSSAATQPTFSIQPNPVVNKTMHINFQKMEGLYSIRLTNKQGATVFTKQITLAAGSQVKDIALGDAVAAGVYDVVLVDAKGKQSVQAIFVQ